MSKEINHHEREHTALSGKKSSWKWPEMAIMADQLEEIDMPIIGTNIERIESE